MSAEGAPGRVQHGVCTWVVASLVVFGCAAEENQGRGETLYSTVASYEDDTSCSTAVVEALSRQIADEVNCLSPDTLTTIAEGGGIDFAYAHVLPYVTPEGKAGLLAAVAGGGTLTITSLYRTVPQQFLLYRWWQQGRCGIAAAATPGRSNHESGRAIDVSNWDDWVGVLDAHGWEHDVPGDDVHFDHVSSPDLRGMDVHAFQRLWNRNHPEDLIDESGDYDSDTAARLAAAPAEGFPAGGCEATSPPDGFDARFVAENAPATLLAGARVEVVIELDNTGTLAWSPSTTFLATTSPHGRASAFFDSNDWLAADRPTAVDANTPPGARGRFSFSLRAPPLATTTPFHETFGLVSDDGTWFGPEDITIDVTVHPEGVDPGGPGVDPGPGGDDGEIGGAADDPGGAGGSHDDAILIGGCDVGGGGAGRSGGLAAPWLMLLLALVRRPRRARPACPPRRGART